MERLTTEHIDKAKHCIGLDYKKPYKRHGKKFYKPYRNFYCTSPTDKIWNELKEKGYAVNDEPKKECCNFWLTRKGLDWLGELLGIKIYDRY